MNYAPLRIQRITRELSEELVEEYGVEDAARILEQAAEEIRRTANSRATGPTEDVVRLVRALSSPV
jgi:hypothetical protein